MTPLGRILAETIRVEGPLTVERYMALALGHPIYGYYTTRDPLGAAGDFTTAPEISQMFGELLGLWAAEVWSSMGRPTVFRLIEIGPGRGTLMADALRAARLLPAFGKAADLHLVETSRPLCAAQARALAGSPAAPTWHDAIATVPEGPAIVIANELMDALPIRQFVRSQVGWHERLVGLDPDGRLAFGLAAEPDRRVHADGALGDVLEIGDAACALVGQIGTRLARDGGAALIIDYGYSGGGHRDTLQAVRAHAYTDPLDAPGEADLTAHVDFDALARVAEHAGVTVHGPASQGDFLRALGIEARAMRLAAASPASAAAIATALARLTGDDGMGMLFRTMAIADRHLSELPGLPHRHSGAPQASPELINADGAGWSEKLVVPS